MERYEEKENAGMIRERLRWSEVEKKKERLEGEIRMEEREKGEIVWENEKG